MTRNKQIEILDVVNEKDEIIGQATREECHSNPKLIHRVAHCWLFNFDGQVLWQQRSLKKKQAPGMWDMSCGGHIPSGETPYTGLLRELNEELGVTDVDPVLVTKYIDGDENQIEMIYLFYGTTNLSEKDFILQSDEVEQVVWINFDDALELYTEKKVAATPFLITQVPMIYQKVFSNNQRRAYWQLPQQIKDVGFDFRWDVKKVWELDLPVEDIDINELVWHFDIPFWFTKGGFYDQQPNEVLNNPELYNERIERIKATDLTYPIDIMMNKGRWTILDGLHRLAHHYLQYHKIVKVRKVPIDSLESIRK